MEWYEILIGILLVITSIAIVILVLMQQSRRAGLSGAISGGAETFFGKNKGKSTEAKMKKWTWICLAILVVFSIIFYVLQLESLWA